MDIIKWFQEGGKFKRNFYTYTIIVLFHRILY